MIDLDAVSVKCLRNLFFRMVQFFFDKSKCINKAQKVRNP
jgi:hypothetical protein